jgi:small conductance mechanosensitive channel
MFSAAPIGMADLRSIAEWLARTLSVPAGLLVQRGVQILGVLLLAYLGFRVLKLVTSRIERAVDDGDPTTVSEREQRGKTLAQLLNHVGAVAIAVGAGLTILNFFIAIGPLLAAAGVAGLAISFGAQSLVKDVISGFFILLENQFGVGDIVEVNGVGGVVERMTMRVVMLRDVHGVLHVVPNGSINLVSNKTRGWARAVVDIGVAYKENVDNVIRVMRDVAAELWRDADWKGRLFEEPAVWGVEQLADSSVNIRLVAMTLPGKQWEVGREIRRRLKNRFDREGIEIRFPQRTLHLGDAEQLASLLSARAEESPASRR